MVSSGSSGTANTGSSPLAGKGSLISRRQPLILRLIGELWRHEIRSRESKYGSQKSYILKSQGTVSRPLGVERRVGHSTLLADSVYTHPTLFNSCVKSLSHPSLDLKC